MSQTNIPNPSRYESAPPERDLFASAPPGEYTALGEQALAGLFGQGVRVAVRGKLNGDVSIDLFPAQLENPPAYVRIFGRRYKLVEEGE